MQKLEGGQEITSIIRPLTEVDIPVMAYVGLLPQRHSAMSGYKVQGRNAEGAKKVVNGLIGISLRGTAREISRVFHLATMSTCGAFF